jgi:hypothetical protein
LQTAPGATEEALIDWTSARPGRLRYSHVHFAEAKAFLLDQWGRLGVARGAQPSAPGDLSGACKYGSLFAQYVFGGAIRGHFEHQYNLIEGRLVDLSHDALDVGHMRHPYQHEPDFFLLPELQRSLGLCVPRAERWGAEFLALTGNITQAAPTPAPGDGKSAAFITLP